MISEVACRSQDTGKRQTEPTLPRAYCFLWAHPHWQPWHSQLEQVHFAPAPQPQLVLSDFVFFFSFFIVHCSVSIEQTEQGLQDYSWTENLNNHLKLLY